MSRDVLLRPSEFAPRLLAWYAVHGRDLPWRVKGGSHHDPYIVWVSEIMLQQTTVATVIPYFHRFIERFPDLPTLATASLEDILTVWQGLGYYRRAHQLYACGQYLLAEHGGTFPRPSQPEDLCKLPGIGAYTAASIAALAFSMSAAVVDGNVARILSRLYCVDVPFNRAKNRFAAWAQELLPETDFADYTSAIMDLGATICRPQNPACMLCPWREGCEAHRRGKSECYPKKERREKPSYSGCVYWVEDEQGRVLVRRRAQGSLLSGLSEFPWIKNAEEANSIAGDVTVADSADATTWPVRWETTGRSVRHTFTHFHLKLTILRGCVDCADFTLFQKSCDALAESLFVPLTDFSLYPFSRLMRKVIEAMTAT